MADLLRKRRNCCVAAECREGARSGHSRKMMHAKKKDRLAAVSPKPNRMFGSGGCALGFFDLEVASNSIEHGHLSLLDRCDGIVDGERSLVVQHLGIIRSA